MNGDNSNKIRTPLTFTIYEALWEDYRNGTRTVHQLANKYELTNHTVKTLITKGSPNRRWQALAERLAQYERDQAMLRDRKLLDEAQTETVAISQARAKLLQLSSASLGISAQMFSILMKELPNSSFATYRKVRLPNGEVVYEKQPVDGFKIVAALKTIAETSEIQSRIVLNIADPETRAGVLKTVNNTLSIKANITQAQLEEMAQTGQLPPGVTEADLLGLDPATIIQN